MFNKGKYVIGTVTESMLAVDAAILFPETVSHSHIGRTVFRGEVISAGFFSIDDAGNVSVYGESVSLGLSSREVDIRFVCNTLGVEVPTSE